MIIEVIVWRAETDCNVYLEESLAERLRFGNIPDINAPHSALLGLENFGEIRITFKVLSRSVGGVRGLRDPSDRPRQAEGKRRRVMTRTRPEVILQSLPDRVRSANV